VNLANFGMTIGNSMLRASIDLNRDEKIAPKVIQATARLRRRPTQALRVSHR
jgi:hypothetical protein